MKTKSKISFIILFFFLMNCSHFIQELCKCNIPYNSQKSEITGLLIFKDRLLFGLLQKMICFFSSRNYQHNGLVKEGFGVIGLHSQIEYQALSTWSDQLTEGGIKWMGWGASSSEQRKLTWINQLDAAMASFFFSSNTSKYGSRVSLRASACYLPPCWNR